MKNSIQNIIQKPALRFWPRYKWTKKGIEKCKGKCMLKIYIINPPEKIHNKWKHCRHLEEEKYFGSNS